MKRIIKKVPIPLSGVMLGTAALGNLLQSYSEGARYICGGIAFILLGLLLLKLVLYPENVKEELKQPIPASISATFPMGIMLLSVYAKPFLGNISLFIWYGAIVLHIVIILYFTYKFMLKPDIKKVFASYFIVYVGIAVAGISAPAYGQETIGTAAFIFGFVSLLVMLLLIGYRYIKYPDIPEPAKPIACIFAALASLCLAAYLQSVSDKMAGMVIFMVVLAGVLYVFAVIQLISCLKLKFYPSFSAFTFPFVISAIAMKQTAAWLANMSMAQPYLPYIVLIQTIIAAVLVIYTLIRYVLFLSVSR